MPLIAVLIQRRVSHRLMGKVGYTGIKAEI